MRGAPSRKRERGTRARRARSGAGRAAAGRVLALALLALPGCRGGPDGPPSVLLVTIDTTRADRIGAWGHGDAHTPTIDRLAAEGVLFERAVAPSPLTLPSHASILTGVPPFAHGALGNGLYRLGEGATTLAEVLAAAGWHTAASVGSYVLDARFGLDQGFASYRDPPPDGSTGYASRRAGRVVDDAVDWLQWLEPGERFLLWTHFFDPHANYEAPAPWSERLEDPYDAEIAYVDAELSRLLEAVHALGHGANLLVVVTSDHGESLGEHGERTHGWFVYQATQHVPLLFWGAPVSASRGVRVPDTVSIVGVAASILALVGLPADAMPAQRTPSLFEPDGRVAPADEPRAVVVESHLPWYTMRWRAARGLVWGHESFIDADPPELYDLESDPGERRDLAARRPERVRAMRARLEARRGGSLGWSDRLRVGTDASARLEALGYLVGAPSAPRGGDPFSEALPDSHGRIAQAVAIREAHDLIQESQALGREAASAGSAFARGEAERRRLARLESARALLAPIVAAHPDGVLAAARLAVVEIALGDPAQAERRLERVVALEPAMASAQYNRGIALRALGRHGEAAAAFERAVALEPGEPRYRDALSRHRAERGTAAGEAALTAPAGSDPRP